jgi:4-hydroxy-2-oxoheptanedioate aldolase
MMAEHQRRNAMRVNTTKQKLDEGKVVFGGIISGFAPEMVEILALVGYDFAFFDCEHGPMSYDQVEQMVRAAEAAGVTPIVRVPDHEDSTLLRYLDRGVQGLIIPHVNTKEDAERVVAAARYFPEGHRGIAGGRAHDHNINAGRVETTAFINDNLLVIPMCEELEAVNNLEAIVSVPGVDVVHTGSSDLGQSMGNPPLPEVRALMGEIVQRVRAGGKHAGIGGNAPTDAAGVGKLIEGGADFVTISALALLRLGAEQFRSQSLQAAGRS